ncbi:MAG: type II secretion system F family protein [Nevskia sp.]|nr:type II secretion system F family protein [Nevskia sp.]
MTTATVITVFLALALLAAAAWLYSLAQARQREEQATARLRVDEEAAGSAAALAGGQMELRNPLLRWIAALLWRAGIEPQPRQLIGGLVALAVAILLVFVLGGWLLGALIAFVALVLIYLVLLRRAAARRSRIIEQLPVYLENVARILSAGNSLEEALAAAARESSDPIRPLFMSVARQVKLGAPTDQVLAEVGELYRLRDLKVMALAASVNRRYGGSLRPVFKSLITAIRQRELSARELRALTAETRFSAVVLAVVPIGLTLFIFFRNRNYYSVMWHDPIGHWLLIGAALLQVAGVIILWRMVNSVGSTD